MEGIVFMSFKFVNTIPSLGIVSTNNTSKWPFSILCGVKSNGYIENLNTLLYIIYWISSKT